MKTEIRNSLWQVTLSSWIYSDHVEEVLLFSWNTKEEILNSLKVLLTSKDEWYEYLISYHYWIRYNTEVYQFKAVEEYQLFDSTCEYNIWDVRIERAKIIFTWDEIANNNIYDND